MHSAQMNIPNLVLRLTDAIMFDIYMKKRELSDEAIVSMLGNIKASFLHEAGEDSSLRLEVERVVAGHKFKLLSARNATLDEVDKLYREVLKLGFSNLLEEGTVGIFYAQYCIGHEKFQLARVVLEELLRKAGDASLGPPRVRKDLAKDAKRLLSELHDRDG